MENMHLEDLETASVSQQRDFVLNIWKQIFSLSKPVLKAMTSTPCTKNQDITDAIVTLVNMN